MASVSENCFLESECFFYYQNKIWSIPKTMYLYLRWAFFSMKHSWTKFFNLSFSFQWDYQRYLFNQWLPVNFEPFFV